ncbi:SGNH/GDSL hydrolase family protein [Niabella aurantiaca]|uniref:SGNH/GDSL hydrolase family protein n=1 Tax=Niabella aurantiaca TaxID=379900 RepID=UPI00037D618C|nr:SGNH/GDSL hydrolase family protein [Niabella aurantiaca]
MRYSILFLILLLKGTGGYGQADTATYLSSIKAELQKEWPKNRTINLVFHGHSVPSGYFKTPFVNTFDSYPYQVLKQLKERYPNAVVNVIVTAIGGENSESGEKRFRRDVLSHRPDILFIDYALNDRMMGTGRSRIAWEKMIKAAQEQLIPVILLTPTPHQQFPMTGSASAYAPFAAGIRELAKKYNTGLADSYAAFEQKLKEGHSVTEYMSQVNHPNKEGHAVVAREIMKWF